MLRAKKLNAPTTSPTETAVRKPVALENAKISLFDLIQFISSKFHSQEKN